MAEHLDIIDQSRARLAACAVTRGYPRQGLEEQLAADAFAQARAIRHAHGGDHAEIMAAITPTPDEVDAERARRRQAARQTLDEQGLLPEDGE